MENRLTDAQAMEIFVLWENGASRTEISERFNVPVGAVFDRKRPRRGKGHLAHPSLENLPVKQGRGGGRRRGDAYAAEQCPSPAEIAFRCEQIRLGKTSREA